MSITFVGSNTQVRTNGLGISLSLPTSLQGDLVLVFTGCQDETKGGAPTTSGYTTLANLLHSGATCRLHVSYKFMGSTPDTTVAVNGTADGAMGLVTLALVFRGVSTISPLDVAAVTTNAGSSTWACPSVTPANNDCCIITAAASVTFDDTVGSISSYLPSPVVQVAADDATGTGSITVAAAYRILSGGASVAQTPGVWTTWGQGVPLKYDALTFALRVGSEVDLITVSNAAVTYTGKSVVQRELVAVSKATVSYAGKTINIPDSSVDSVFVDKAIVSYAGKTVNAGDVLRAVTVTPAAVLYRGRTVTPRDITFEDIPRYSIKGRGSGHWMETR